MMMLGINFASRLHHYCLMHIILIATFLPAAEAHITIGPRNVVALAGSSVELKCTITQRTCQGISWTRVDKSGQTAILSVNDGRMLEDYGGRYSVSVSSVTGECVLSIAQLEKDDAGVFTCHLKVPGSAVQKKSAVLSVFESSPQLSINATILVFAEGDTVNLSCSLSYSSKLQVTMVLLEDGHHIPSTSVTKNSGSEIYTSTVLTAKRKEPFGGFKCRVTLIQTDNNPDYSKYPIESVSSIVPAADVHYPVGRSANGETVPCALKPDDTSFQPGEKVTCHCDGLPPPTYKWLRRPQNETFVDGPVISVNVSTFSTYHCEAENVVGGKTYRGYSLEISFNRTTPRALHSKTPVVAVVVPVVIVAVVIIIVIILIVVIKRKKSTRSSPKASEAHSSLPLMNTASPDSRYSQAPAAPTPTKPPVPKSSPPADPPLTAQRRPAPVAPLAAPRTRTSDHPDIIPMSAAPRPPITPTVFDTESEGIVYADLQRPPQKPPRSTPTASDTVYATIATA